MSLCFVGLSSESTQLLSQRFGLIFVFLCGLLGMLDLLLEVGDLFRELGFEVFKLLFDLLQLDIKVIFLLLFLIVLLIECSKLIVVLLLRLLKVYVFISDELLLLLDLFFLIQDLSLHSFPLSFFIFLVVTHVLLELIL